VGDLRRFFAALLFTLLAACAHLDYDAVGIHGNVVKGGQTEIDQGKIVDVNGLDGIWLAGHRTTHGAVFANLTRAQVGDKVCVYSACWHVVRIIYQPDHHNPGYLGPLVLQTSFGSGVLLVVCV
jgi:hypothetical protein